VETKLQIVFISSVQNACLLQRSPFGTGRQGRRRSQGDAFGISSQPLGGSLPQEREFRQLKKEYPVRKQYYFRPSSQGLLAWDVDRLVGLTSTFPRKHVPLKEIRELDEVWSSDDEPLTWRVVIEHVKLIQDADLSFPIIMSSSGVVMDGMHRVAKALMLKRTEVEAVQFDKDPDPDYIGLGPSQLPY